MAKKFFAAMILALAIVITGGQASKAEAGEYYVGNYSDGTAVYLQTHRVRIRSYNPYSFECVVRAGGDYLGYAFFPNNGSPYYRNSEGYEGFVFGGQSPVAANIYRYVVNNY